MNFLFCRLLVSECLYKLGFSIAASNARTTKDFDLLKLYAQQVVEQSKRSWKKERRDSIIERFKDLGLI